MQVQCKSHLEKDRRDKRSIGKLRAMGIKTAGLIGLSALFVLYTAHQGCADPLKQSAQNSEYPGQTQGQVSAKLVLDAPPKVDFALLKPGINGRKRFPSRRIIRIPRHANSSGGRCSLIRAYLARTGFPVQPVTIRHSHGETDCLGPLGMACRCSGAEPRLSWIWHGLIGCSGMVEQLRWKNRLWGPSRLLVR